MDTNHSAFKWPSTMANNPPNNLNSSENTPENKDENQQEKKGSQAKSSSQGSKGSPKGESSDWADEGSESEARLSLAEGLVFVIGATNR